MASTASVSDLAWPSCDRHEGHRPDCDQCLRERMRVDTPLFASIHLKITTAAGKLVALEPKPAQLKFDAALEDQRRRGLPMRAIVLKARKEGISTWTQAKMMQRLVQTANHNALVVAQDKATAGELFSIGERMYNYFPHDSLVERPLIAGTAKRKELWFANPVRREREAGKVGLDSRFIVDTANELEVGRGFTLHSVHCSELASWPDAKAKLSSLLNAVPDVPETMVVLESTAKGSNYFKTLWDQAVEGKSENAAVFIPWFDEPAYVRAFYDDRDRTEFEARVGEDSVGEDEPELIRRMTERGFDYELVLRKLNWRRAKIASASIGGDLRTFRQEYPATPEEAFLASGSQVFQLDFISRVKDDTKRTDPLAERGVLRPGLTKRMRSQRGVTELFEVPTTAIWTPQGELGGEVHQWVRVWERPDPGDEVERRAPGQYVVAVDPAGDAENEDGETAFKAVQVIDHRTRGQVAEYRSRIDPDLVGDVAFLLALFYNRATLAAETTGGYGLSMVKRWYLDYHYPFVYMRRSEDDRQERKTDRLGWDTNRASKVLLEDGMRTLLREGCREGNDHGIKSALLASEIGSYVKDPKTGRTGPEPGKFSDLLMAFMIAQQVADETPIRQQRKRERSSTTSTYKPLDPVGGY